MSLFDDNVSNAADQLPAPQPPAEQSSAQSSVCPLAGDPITYVAATQAAPGAPKPQLPEDIRVSWSWPHFIVFLFFGFASLLVVQAGFMIYFTTERHLSQKQVMQLFESKPQLLLGTNIVWYALLFLFLYVTLAVLRGSPFWRSLGWKKIEPSDSAQPKSPWIYFFSGCGLSIFVAFASSGVRTTDHVPIQELFKNRSAALMFMSMAVLIAPLVEETVFRGYIYPLFAKSFGVAPGIVVTGVLFGLMHGAQLGWTWGLVSLLILVGVIFTFVRARTGTVFASYMLHLGYNSMIALTSFVLTKGFQQGLPGH